MNKQNTMNAFYICARIIFIHKNTFQIKCKYIFYKQKQTVSIGHQTEHGNGRIVDDVKIELIPSK